MGYFHEQDKTKSNTFNTSWPVVASDERANKLFRQYLKGRRIDFETAYLAGVYPSRMDCFRVVLPCKSTQEGHAYYQARAINPDIKKRYDSPYGRRCGALFCADTVFDLDKDALPFRAIVEGPMDALALASCGVNAIALMGISPDKETKEHLVSLCKKDWPCVIMFDNEDEATAKASELALYLASHGIPSRVFVPKSKDFAASSDSEQRAYVKEFTAWANKQRLSTRNSERRQKTLV